MLGTLLAEDGNDPLTIAAVLGNGQPPWPVTIPEPPNDGIWPPRRSTRSERKRDIFRKPSEKTENQANRTYQISALSI
jgi:hypothetical protein